MDSFSSRTYSAGSRQHSLHPLPRALELDGTTEKYGDSDAEKENQRWTRWGSAVKRNVEALDYDERPCKQDSDPRTEAYKRHTDGRKRNSINPEPQKSAEQEFDAVIGSDRLPTIAERSPSLFGSFLYPSLYS